MARRKSKADDSTYSRAYVYRIYPTKEQAIFINQNIGAARFIYNAAYGHYIEKEREAHLRGEKYYFSLKESTELYQELKSQEKYAWLKDVDSLAIFSALDNLETAFENIKENREKILKRGGKLKYNSGWPNFKKKKSNKGSYTTRRIGNSNNIVIKDNTIKLPKCTPITMIYHRPLPEGAVIKGATVTRTPDDKYFVSVKFNAPKEMLVKGTGEGEIGIDVGIKNFYTDHEGNTVDNPRFKIRAERKLRRLQRQQSHMLGTHDTRKDKSKGKPKYDFPCKSDMKNLEKIRKKVAKAERKVAKQREHFQHNLAKTIAEENNLVCMEHLNIAGLTEKTQQSEELKKREKKQQNKDRADVGWYSFMSKVKYKVEDRGGQFVQVDTYYPSSQLCFNCGFKNEAVKDLKVRFWICPQCGAAHDRDINAAKNILRQGKKML